MKYPKGMATDAERLAFCCAAQERLRLAHNVVGTWFREGAIDSRAMDSLPESWRNSLAADREGKLSEASWKEFKDETYDAAEKDVIEELHRMRDAVIRDAALINLDDVLSK